MTLSLFFKDSPNKSENSGFSGNETLHLPAICQTYGRQAWQAGIRIWLDNPPSELAWRIFLLKFYIIDADKGDKCLKVTFRPPS